ncbi:phage replisome organizer N-terminal domain-containing protein [Clostridium oryzae]|uniref:Phage replisome organiser N-terminal domain-containing protein n=1 Tax=Clostridium oryzae TaxID=1450648 RepID=A0A1V4IRZ7_9CLOT|nr:phage replisome organizer N-terminal domain-containing protein [Clostridium oryzae]OPJ62574.1 hypothetical protein CLORY_17040 [Clostridium oryzae]
MRERRYVKLRVDMYEDTKFKIMDSKPERDVIFYIWSRIVLLAGKVNLVGELYLSKNIPYTIETLAIEFNRDISQVKLALDTFIELEMLELTEDKVYKVRNFAKHQNIKAEEKEISDNIEGKLNTTAALSDNPKLEIVNDKDKTSENKLVENSAENAVAATADLEVTSKNGTAAIDEDIMENSLKEDSLHKNDTLVLETKKNKKRNRNKKNNLININAKAQEILNSEAIDDEVCSLAEGDVTSGEEKSVVAAWSFG